MPKVPCEPSARACVSLSRNIAWLTDNGRVILGPVPITAGRADYPTPQGVMHVQWKDINHRSREFNDAPMPYSVFFASGDAFHEGDLQTSSHGCIHLSHTAAMRFFDFLRIGDEVQILR